MILETVMADGALHPVFYGKPLIFKPGSHRYFWDGKPVPSVTTILGRLGKDALIQWAANCAVDHILDNVQDTEGISYGTFLDICTEARRAHTVKRDAGADTGTLVHDYAHALLLGKDTPVITDGKALMGCKALDAWMVEHKVVPFGLERKVFSKEHWYAGTADIVGLIDERPGVLDWKTSKAIYDEYWLQTAGYALAVEEEIGWDTADVRRHVIRLDKETGAFEHQERSWTACHEDAFLAIVAYDKAARLFKKAV